MKRSILGAAALVAMLASSSAATAAVIASESFESPALTAPADQYGPDEAAVYDTGSTGPVVIPNFTFTSFSGIMTNGLDGIFPDTSFGKQVGFVQTYRNTNGEIDWALSGLTPNHQYALSFEYVSSSAVGQEPFSVSAFGGAPVTYNPSDTFVTETLDFTPSTANGSIQFINKLAGVNSLNAIDNLTVSTVGGVPEPASWIIMILGCGMAGADCATAAARRTSSQADRD
jgi:hypothetical protein